MKIKEGICPKCGNNLHHGAIDIEEGSVFYPVNCESLICNFEGKEYHSLTFNGIWDNDGNEITGD